MRDLFDFLLAPVRVVPLRVAILFGVLLALSLFLPMTWFPMSGLAPHVLRTRTGVALCFAAGLVGASRGREFYHGILAVFAAILIANLIGLLGAAFAIRAATLAGTASPSFVRETTDLPLFGMVLLGLPVGTVGAGVAAWLRHSRTVA
jgi:hypothetical protein